MWKKEKKLIYLHFLIIFWAWTKMFHIKRNSITVFYHIFRPFYEIFRTSHMRKACEKRIFTHVPVARKYKITAHYNDVIMGAIASEITGLPIVYSTVYSGADERKHQSSVSLAFVREIHRWPVNSTHKGPATQIMFPFHHVIMPYQINFGGATFWRFFANTLCFFKIIYM